MSVNLFICSECKRLLMEIQSVYESCDFSQLDNVTNDYEYHSSSDSEFARHECPLCYGSDDSNRSNKTLSMIEVSEEAIEKIVTYHKKYYEECIERKQSKDYEAKQGIPLDEPGLKELLLPYLI